MEAEDDVIRQLKQDLDLARRRMDEKLAGELSWRLAQIMRRRGSVDEFIEFALKSSIAFFNERRPMPAAEALIAVLQLPRQEFRPAQRAELLLASYVYHASYVHDQGAVDAARSELMSFVDEVGGSMPAHAGCLLGYVKWWESQQDASLVFYDAAASASREGGKYFFSRPSLLMNCVRSAFDTREFELAEKALSMLGDRGSRHSLSSYHQVDHRLFDALLRYHRIPGAATRKDVLAACARRSHSLKQAMLIAEIEYLTSDASLSERDKLFRSGLSKWTRRVDRSISFHERFAVRQHIAGFTINALRLARGLKPRSLRPEITEIGRAPRNGGRLSDYEKWRALAARAVSAFERGAARMDGRYNCRRFSAIAAIYRADFEELAMSLA